MIRTTIKFFLSFSLAVFSFVLFVFVPKQILACSSVELNPAGGYVAGEPIELIATGCEVGEEYIFSLSLIDDNFDTTLMDQGHPNPGGRVILTVTPPKAGEYLATLQLYSNVFDFIFEKEIAVDESEEEVIFQCGDIVPTNTATCASGESGQCCPSECPRNTIQRPGSLSDDIIFCECGTPGTTCCPPSSGFSSCFFTTTDVAICNSNNICEFANVGTEVFRCGETNLDPDAACVAECPLTRKNDGTYWCACGQDAGLCCSVGPECQTPGYVCERGYCVEPNYTGATLVAYCADGSYGVETAFGCFRYTSLSRGIAALISLAVGIAGGVTLFFIALSAFIIITSAGDPQKLEQGKGFLISAISGLLMVVLSVWLLRVIGIDVLGLWGV